MKPLYGPFQNWNSCFNSQPLQAIEAIAVLYPVPFEVHFVKMGIYTVLVHAKDSFFVSLVVLVF